MNTAIQINTADNVTCVEFPNNKKKSRKPVDPNYIRPKAQAVDSIKSKEEIKLIQEYFLNKQEYRNYLLFTIGISVGLRISDLVTLQYSDLMYKDFSFKSCINIEEKKTGKSSTNATDDCLITDYMKEAIKLYMSHLNEKPEISDYIFTSRKGGCIDERSAHKILKQMSRDTGLDKKYNIGTHTMRKTLAYWTIKLHPNDMNVLIALQMMLKHSSLRSTFSYAGITKEETSKMRMDLGEFYESIGCVMM